MQIILKKLHWVFEVNKQKRRLSQQLPYNIMKGYLFVHKVDLRTIANRLEIIRLQKSIKLIMNKFNYNRCQKILKTVHKSCQKKLRTNRPKALFSPSNGRAAHCLDSLLRNTCLLFAIKEKKN